MISEHAAKDEVSRRHFIENAERIVFEAVAEQLRSDGSLKALQSIEAQEEAFENTFSRGWAETREWSARVIEIRAWQKPVLETIQASGRNWLPADIDPSVGETLGRIPDHDVEGMLKAVRSALENALPAVVHETAGEFPATELIAEALERRLEIMKEKHLAGGNDAEPVLPISHDNFFELTFREQPVERQSARDNALPDGVLRPLQYHQRQALNWQIECWRKGLPGILNADEQGLGKTLQTLAFLTWLTEVMRFDPKWAAPILIVAPTSLLRNWEDEIGKHLKPDIWGKPVRLYGAHLVPFKTNGVSGQDIQDGEARLDFGALMDAKGPKLAVTTYQTLANYAVSFAETRFAAIVYDEIQNLKNPATLRSTAARATHADFKIGLTGTPVENKTQDLWAIMDQLVPGALGSLVDFKDLYDTPTAERIRGLNAAVFTRHGDIPR
nr:SNF2-related protein [Marinicella sp. W31]MDC2877026.1 SNF2-related protein [Marinicella sp. W31]